MAKHEGAWAAGTPSWVDIQVGDLPRGLEFYGQLFGWDLTEIPDGGGYTMASRDGLPLAGIGPSMVEGAPPAWVTYIASDDVDETVEKVLANGGAVLFQPMDVMTAGRMALVSDPSGAVFGLWQGRDHLGAGFVNEPGTLTWNELHTGDYDGSKEFYSAVFGYTYTEIGNGADFQYSVIGLPGSDDSLGGIMADPQVPSAVPPYWLAWFAVAGTDAVVERAVGLGATVVAPPADSPNGRMSILTGPQGEIFAIIDAAQVAGA